MGRESEPGDRHPLTPAQTWVVDPQFFQKAGHEQAGRRPPFPTEVRKVRGPWAGPLPQGGRCSHSLPPGPALCIPGAHGLRVSEGGQALPPARCPQRGPVAPRAAQPPPGFWSEALPLPAPPRRPGPPTPAEVHRGASPPRPSPRNAASAGCQVRAVSRSVITRSSPHVTKPGEPAARAKQKAVLLPHDA